MYRTREIALELKLTLDAIRYRAERLNILPKGSSRMHLWTNEEFDKIASFKANSPFKDKYSKIKINIVDFYLSHQHNTQLEIANAMGLKESRVNSVLNEYLVDNYIIVESRING